MSYTDEEKYRRTGPATEGLETWYTCVHITLAQFQVAFITP